MSEIDEILADFAQHGVPNLDADWRFGEHERLMTTALSNVKRELYEAILESEHIRDRKKCVLSETIKRLFGVDQPVERVSRKKRPTGSSVQRIAPEIRHTGESEEKQ
jgi:succinate dehydrogenase flavin-adding protein (antitoxin of CptAB toxin-antitoxin module)